MKQILKRSSRNRIRNYKNLDVQSKNSLIRYIFNTVSNNWFVDDII